MDKMITVFTPTFNRVKTLPRVLNSLLSQDYIMFEWVIVDDGSNDGTKHWVESIIDTCRFPIKYTYQENSGKHIAINKGVEMASGEFIIIADSDDTFSSDALKIFIQTWEEIPIESKNKYAGVWCLCKTESGTIVGKEFPDSPWDCNAVQFNYTEQVNGEKWQMMRLDILRKYPMPYIIEKNLYVGEGIMWLRINKRYLYRCINKPLRTYHDSPDGIMNSGDLRYEKNLKSYYIQYQIHFSENWEYFRFNPKQFFIGMLLYQSSTVLLNRSLYEAFNKLKSAKGRSLFLIMIPLLPLILIYKKVKLIAR